MTEQEIHDLKAYIGRELSERMEKAFVGQSVGDVSPAIVKNYISRVLSDLRVYHGTTHPVVDLVDWDVTFVGRVMNVVMRPKSGLSNEDYRRATDFLFNRGTDSEG